MYFPNRNGGAPVGSRQTSVKASGGSIQPGEDVQLRRWADLEVVMRLCAG